MSEPLLVKVLLPENGGGFLTVMVDGQISVKACREKVLDLLAKKRQGGAWSVHAARSLMLAKAPAPGQTQDSELELLEPSKMLLVACSKELGNLTRNEPLHLCLVTRERAHKQISMEVCLFVFLICLFLGFGFEKQRLIVK